MAHVEIDTFFFLVGIVGYFNFITLGCSYLGPPFLQILWDDCIFAYCFFLMDRLHK
jgi:hypothetical protein